MLKANRPAWNKVNFSAVRGIVFDLDDTLYPHIDFKLSGFKAVSKWLESQIGRPTAETFAKLLDLLQEHGPSYPNFFNDLALSMNLDPIWVRRMIDLFRAHPPEIRLFHEVSNLLTRLKKQYKIGILTDGLWTVQQRKILALGVQKKVDAILYSDRFGTQKPNTILYRWFEKEFKLPCDQLVYIGDNPLKDFIGARRRGWHAIRVRTGEHASLIAPPDFDADLIIDQVKQLESYFSAGIT